MPEDPRSAGRPERAPFFGRTGELAWLRSQCRNLARGSGEGAIIAARPGTGKTELLRHFAETLFADGEIIPFRYEFPRLGWDRASFAADFTTSFATQALAFRRRDSTLCERGMTAEALSEGLRAAWGAGGTLLVESLRAPGAGFPGRPDAAAALLPDRFAALSGMRVLCLLDDFERYESYGSPALASWPAEAVFSRRAPVVLAVSDITRVGALLGRDVASRLQLRRIGPLSEEPMGQLLRNLMRTSGLELGERVCETLVRLASGSPFYLQSLVRAISGSADHTPIDVVRAYADSVSSGDLARYWTTGLEEALPDRAVRGTAIEILAYALREEPDGPDVGRLPSLMFKSEALVEAAVAGLQRAGVAQLDCSRLFVDEDPVFRDVVATLYRREFGRAAPESVAAALAAEKVRGETVERRRRHRKSLREMLRTLLGAWDAQKVPAVLFDAKAFRERLAAKSAPDLAEALRLDQELVALPLVVAVSSGRVGQGTSLAGLEVDALAWGRRLGAEEDADVAWVVRWLPGGAGSAEQLAEFGNAVAAMQAAGDLPGSRLVRWAVFDEPPDSAGEREAERIRIETSTRLQLDALARILRVPAHMPPPLPAAEAAPRILEFGMTLPGADDAELVAARALEQLAENIDLGPEETGRVRTALVEACINAFEHGGTREGRVRLSFAVGGGELRIRVENSGRPISALPAVLTPGESLRKRGWGLTLIRELMDEVTLEPRDDGVSLVMVKRLPVVKDASGV